MLGGESGVPSQLGPRVASLSQDVAQLDACPVQEVLERAVAVPPQLGDDLLPPVVELTANVLEHDVLGLTVHLDRRS